MKLIARKSVESEASNEVETFFVSRAQLDYLGRLANEMNPDMPLAFGGAHVIRTLLERFEQSGIDLTEATSEQEVTRLAAQALRRRNRARQSRG